MRSARDSQTVRLKADTTRVAGCAAAIGILYPQRRSLTRPRFHGDSAAGEPPAFVDAAQPQSASAALAGVEPDAVVDHAQLDVFVVGHQLHACEQSVHVTNGRHGFQPVVSAVGRMSRVSRISNAS